MIALLPQGVEVSPVQAEQTARSAFVKLVDELQTLGMVEGPWWELLAHPHGRRVFRTTLVTRDAYVDALRAGPFPGRSGSRARASLDEYETNLPERLWLVEVTLPQLYVGNRAGLGEVLIRVDAGPYNDIEAVAAFRVPGLLAWAGSRPGAFFAEPFPIRRHRPLHAPLYHRNGW